MPQARTAGPWSTAPQLPSSGNCCGFSSGILKLCCGYTLLGCEGGFVRGLAILHKALGLISYTIAAAAEKAFNLLNPIICYYVASLESRNSFYFEICFAWHFLLFFGDRAPLCGSDWPGIHCAEQAGLEFTGICLLERKDYS